MGGLIYDEAYGGWVGGKGVKVGWVYGRGIQDFIENMI
jgi:hypothetical protein